MNKNQENIHIKQVVVENKSTEEQEIEKKNWQQETVETDQSQSSNPLDLE